MDSLSQHSAHATPRATLDASAKARKRRARGRPSTASIVASFDDELPPSTPLNKAGFRPHAGAFSPFSHRSSQDSPRPTHLSSPSVILFSGPADRGFERVHDDSFPQDLRSLQSMARSKFRFAPTQPIEMSYINPDGIVCELDDEHDLRALAVHAHLAPKLHVHVTSAASDLPTAFANGKAALASSAVAPQILSDGATAANEPQSAPVAASKVATQPITAIMPPPQVPVPAQANGHSNDAASPPKPQKKGRAKAGSTQLTSTQVEGTQAYTNGYDHQFEASQVNGSSAPQPLTPVAKKTSSKRKRTNDSPPSSASAARPSESTAAPTSPSTPSAPVHKKPRGRPKTSLASTTAAGTDNVPDTASVSTDPASSTSEVSAPAQNADMTVSASQPAETVAVPQKEAAIETRKPGRPRKSSATTTVQPTENGTVRNDVSADTPKRGRAKKLAPIEEAASVQQAPLETPKRGRPKKAATLAADQSATPASAAQQTPTQTQESSNGSVTAAASTEIESAVPAVNAQPVEVPAASQPEESSLEQTPAAKAAANPKPHGRASKKAIAETESMAVAPAAASEEASAPSTTAASQQTPSDTSQTNPDLPVKKKRGRPSKADLAARAALLASAEGASAVDAAETPASGANSQAQPVSTEKLAESPEAAAAVVATPKKVGRQPKTAKAARAAAADVEPVTEIGAAVTAPIADTVTSPVAEQPGSVEASAQQMTANDDEHSTNAAQPDENAAGTIDAAPAAAPAPAEVAPSSSAPSQVDATSLESTVAATPATSKRATAATKPRGSKANGTDAAAAASESSEACVVCGATPSHGRKDCPIWKGGSEAILELLAMLRKKSYKNKKDKETVRMLQDWLSLQFNAPALDFTISQDSIQPSQDISLPPAAGQPVKDAAAAVNESADPIVFTQESAVESAPASSPTTGKKASSAKASVAKKSILARATPEPELPPPSGVAAPAEPPSASTAKPTAKAPRAQSKKAAATAQAKAAKKAVASTMSEPNIALTPSSPLQPSQTQFSQPPGTGLRAPSESSEAELATSPLLSAVPRASDDMDVDELPSNTPSRPSTAAQQLEERKRRMKLADAASTSSPRSRSASITSSDTSHGGQSSDDESDADSDAGGTAAKVGRKGTGKQAKPASSKPPRSPVAKKARTAAAARKDASSGTDTSSSDSETESEPDTSKKSTSRAKPSGDNANVKTPASKTTKRLPPPDNPFLRGLTPVSSRQNGAGSNKSTPFTRLSELKPASLRQNLSQPGSPLSTGGSTPLSASGQTPFFASQPVMNGDGNGSTDSSAAAGAFTTAAATPEPAQAETASEDDDESDSSSSSSSEDEAPKRGKASAKASTGAKRAGKGVGAKTATPAAAKKRKSVFDVFGKSG